MKTVKISDLRRNLLSFLKKAHAGEFITITSRGKKIAMIVPAKNESEKSGEILRNLAETAVIEDIVTPIDENWNADR